MAEASSATRRRPTAQWTGLALVAILVLAALLRLWLLNVFPPGLNHDEGVNALDVERIIGGWRPIFLPANNGREALFMYTQALVGAIIGVTPISLRLTAALWGILTVGLTFGLARSWYGSRVGLLAAGLLAVAFWHVVLSRVGLRAISVPALYVGVMWAFSEAFQRRRVMFFLLGGVLLGLAEYTYISARLLPGIVSLISVILLIQERRHARPCLPLFRSLGLAAIAAGIAVLPETYYFIRHPEQLIGRTDQVLVFNSHPAIIGTPITFRQSLEHTFGMFWVAGDTNWLHNIAGLPVLDPLQTLFFLAGVGAILIDLHLGSRGLHLSIVNELAATASNLRSGTLHPSLWLIVWSGVLLAGSSVTQESPNYLRLTALMPAVAITCAIGVTTCGGLVQWLLKRCRISVPITVPALLIGALILGEGARTAILYFHDWGGQGGVYTAFDTDIRDAATASLQQNDVPMADTFIQLDASAPFLFFRPQTRTARWLREYSSVVALPSAGQPALWVYSHFQVVPPLPASLPQAALVAHGLARLGHPGYFLYLMSAPDLAAFRSAFATPSSTTRFGDSLQLVGTQLQSPSSARPGDTVIVLLLWRVLQDASVNFGVSIHLTDDHSVSWAQSDRQGMMQNGWRRGDEFVSRHDITIPADTPPVLLHMVAGASVLDPLHQPAAVLQTLGVSATLVSFTVLPGAPEPAPPLPDHSVTVVPGLAASAQLPNDGPVQPGDTLPVSLHWQRTATVPALTITVAAIDGGGRSVAMTTGDPAYGALPVAALPIGRAVADPRFLQLPAVLPSGPLRIVLIVTKGGHHLAPIALGVVQVQDRQHTFAPPPSQYPLSATFGGQIALLGYDLPTTTVQPGGPLPITFHWQALQTPTHNYTVFVHLLDARGQIAAQNDSQPAAGTLPTLGWLPREVLTDQHVVPLPPSLPGGAYHFEIGWYDATTNQRLTLGTPHGADSLVLPQVITVR